MQPDFSVVQFGRVDDYQGNPCYRQAMSLASFCHCRDLLGLTNMEIVVVDWGSASPLQEALTKILGGELKGIRWLQVPRDHAPTGRINASLAHNVGIRRAVGRHIYYTLGDTLMIPSCWAILEKVVLHEVFPYEPLFLVPRLHFPCELVDKGASPYTLIGMATDWVLRKDGQERDNVRIFFGGLAGWVLKRELWHQARGLDESSDRNDNEFGCRVAPFCPPVDLGEFGCWGVHMDHPVTPWPERRELSLGHSLEANDENWGLGSVELQETQC